MDMLTTNTLSLVEVVTELLIASDSAVVGAMLKDILKKIKGRNLFITSRGQEWLEKRAPY